MRVSELKLGKIVGLDFRSCRRIVQMRVRLECLSERVSASAYVCVCVYIYVHVYACMCMRGCVYAYMGRCIHASEPKQNLEKFFNELLKIT